MAHDDDQTAVPTFAKALRDALGETGVSQKELARRLAGKGASTEQVEAKRSQILKWLRGRHEPEIESARNVERALDLPAGQLQSVINRKPRGRPAALSRDQQIADLQAQLGAVREEVAGLASDLAELRSALSPRSGGQPRGHAGSEGRR